MGINIIKQDNTSLNENDVEIIIKSHPLNNKVSRLINYINEFEKQDSKKVLVNNNNIMEEIEYNDIIYFYSDKKYNYCKTKNNTYKIKSKLYELEILDPNFIRISKGCLANSNHIKCFDISETGRIIIVFDDDSKEYVSRRKLKSIMEFLDERSV